MRMKEQMHALNQKGPDARAAGEGWYQPTPDLFGTWNRFSGPWPRAGMTVDGLAYELPTWVRHTGEIDGGLLPTPSGTNGGTNHTVGRMDEWGGSSNPFRGTALGRVRCAAFEEWMMGWPIQWTALTPFAMVKYLSKRRSHGES